MWGVGQPARLSGPQHPYRRTLRYAASRDMPAVLRIRFSSARQRTGCMATGTARSGRRTTRAQVKARMIARVVFFQTADDACVYKVSVMHARSLCLAVTLMQLLTSTQVVLTSRPMCRWTILWSHAGEISQLPAKSAPSLTEPPHQRGQEVRETVSSQSIPFKAAQSMAASGSSPDSMCGTSIFPTMCFRTFRLR